MKDNNKLWIKTCAGKKIGRNSKETQMEMDQTGNSK